MAQGEAESLPVIGFLTVLDKGEAGLLGGYLVLNVRGRPIEFHCTAPVKANRAQQILYGPALAPWLYGEQIGGTLVNKGKSSPVFVVTDSKEALTLGDVIASPVLYLGDDHQAEEQSTPMHEFQLGRNRVGIPQEKSSNEPAIQKKWEPYAKNIDLSEPFTRIREALEETSTRS